MSGLTITPCWEFHSRHRGVSIFRRVERTGTFGGQWLTAGTYCPSLKFAKTYLDTLKPGHFCGNGERIQDGPLCG